MVKYEHHLVLCTLFTFSDIWSIIIDIIKHEKRYCTWTATSF